MNRLVKISIVSLFITSFNYSLASADVDPFPGIAQYQEIPGTRVSGDQAINCPDGSGKGIEVNATTHETFSYCVKTWRPTVDINADKDYQDRINAAQSAAEAESKAWNAANPGKQKCVQWGPIVHANGVTTSSGGVCANPVEAGPNTSVQTQDTTGVTGPTVQTSSPSKSATSPSSAPEPTGFSKNSGNGYPFTVILEGQKSISDCPSGYQAGTGLIAQIGTGTFTECWPPDALNAWRLGGSYWDQFKNSGGSFDVQSVMDRLATISEYKSKAKTLAQKAADETPGVQRCSAWSVYGENGQECAYTFINPISTNSPSTNTSTNGTTISETSTSTTLPSGDTITVNSETLGSIPTPTNTSFVNGVASPTIGIVATSFSGTPSEVVNLIKKVETVPTVLNAVTSAVDKLQKVSSKTYAKSIKLPDVKTATETAISLTPEICTVTNLNVNVVSKGTCKIEYNVTSTTGNTYTTEKIIEFKKSK